MIRWRFYFDQGDVTTEPETEDEDNAIMDNITERPYDLLDLSNSKGNLFVNLRLVKCITRTIENVDQAGPESTT